MCFVFGCVVDYLAVASIVKMSCFSQGSAATLFRFGLRDVNFPQDSVN